MHRPILVTLVLTLATASASPADPLRQAVDLRSGSNRDAAAAQGRIDRLADQADRMSDEYRGILEQLESLRTYTTMLEGLVEEQGREIETTRTEIDNVARTSREILPLLDGMIESLERFVELDLPFLADERRDRVARLRAMLGRADVAESEKFRRVLEAYQIENDYGRTIESYRDEVSIGGEDRTVDVLRIGRVTLLYRTLDGRDLGAWDRERGGWVTLGDEYRIPNRQGDPDGPEAGRPGPPPGARSRGDGAVAVSASVRHPRRRGAALATALLLAWPAIAMAEAESLEELLRQVRSELGRESSEVAAREKEFRQARDRQAALLAQAKARARGGREEGRGARAAVRDERDPARRARPDPRRATSGTSASSSGWSARSRETPGRWSRAPSPAPSSPTGSTPWRASPRAATSRRSPSSGRCGSPSRRR